jgi:hypothetical protein
MLARKHSGFFTLCKAGRVEVCRDKVSTYLVLEKPYVGSN